MPPRWKKSLGVPPAKVIDVMALRGDTIDNIPGAPGIGDKGSVDLIKEFGSVEAVLDRAEEVKRKTYRESLQQNRDAVLLSKELVTIDCNVPVELDLHAMQPQAPDLEGCRELFTELEFTSMLKELAPDESAVKFELIESPPRSSAPHSYAARAARLRVRDGCRAARPCRNPTRSPLSPRPCRFSMWSRPRRSKTTPALAFAPIPALRLRFRLTDEFARFLRMPQCPKRVHDYKSALHALHAQGIELARCHRR